MELDCPHSSASIATSCLFVVLVGRLLTLRRHFALPKRSTFKTTETNLKQHTEGRAHRARLGRVAQSERSVYVRGFPVSASHNTLQNFFQKKFEGYEDVWLSATVSCGGGEGEL